MKSQRNVSDEQILYALLDLRRTKAIQDLYEEIEVLDGESGVLGEFEYLDKESGETKQSKIFKISEMHDGKAARVFYDDKGQFIGIEEDGKLELSNNIVIDEEQFKSFIESEPDRENEEESAGTQNGGEGRDLANKEHEEKTEEEEKEDTKEEKKEENDDEKLKNKKGQMPNLRGKINVYEETRLDQMINGHYLWQILDLDEKLKGKLPNGISPEDARSGFLARANSNDLNKVDGGERKTEDTFVLRTVNGDIIELGEDILQPVELGTLAERQRAEDNRMREGTDGKQQEKPDKKWEQTRTTMYRIPNANERFNVAENWLLGVDKSRAAIHSETPYAGNHKEISFVQVSRNESYYNREERINNTVETKLRTLNEPEQAGGKESQEGLYNKDPNEAENVRNNYIEKIVKECCEQHPEYKEYYNQSDIKEKVISYQADGLDENEIIDQVGEDIHKASEHEHGYPEMGTRPRQ